MIDKLSANNIISSQHRISESIGMHSGKIEEIYSGLPQDERAQEGMLPREKVEEIVEGLNDFVQASLTSIRFEFHEKLHEYYVTVVDTETDEVVREIPPKKMLDIYAAMTEFLGLMVDKKI
ncbi:flagellar protein FlaG [Mesobacillus zeae]|uniref:Flagellar protein FlaG n=1 Tax=Mesobacillus zeae TaxID=1917180 RepID=A0A398B5P2_9BACI|nr:flagellar protein FlaG [Mesobacillus zeae]RID84871.1 flagellar protein FlaG [Mesobacillus zeae]